MDGREQVVTLRGEGGDGAIAFAQPLDKHVILSGEEPDGTVIAFNLGSHRSGMAVLNAVKAEHHGHIGL
jgi:hypothetical protein